MIRLLLAYLFSALVGSYVWGLIVCLIDIIETGELAGSLSAVIWPFYGAALSVYIKAVIGALILLLVIGTPLFYVLRRKNVLDVWRASLWGAGIGVFLAQMALLLYAWLNQTWVAVFIPYSLIMGAVAGAVYVGLAWFIIRPKTTFL